MSGTLVKGILKADKKIPVFICFNYSDFGYLDPHCTPFLGSKKLPLLRNTLIAVIGFVIYRQSSVKQPHNKKLQGNNLHF